MALIFLVLGLASGLLFPRRLLPERNKSAGKKMNPTKRYRPLSLRSLICPTTDLLLVRRDCERDFIIASSYRHLPTGTFAKQVLYRQNLVLLSWAMAITHGPSSLRPSSVRCHEASSVQRELLLREKQIHFSPSCQS